MYTAQNVGDVPNRNTIHTTPAPRNVVLRVNYLYKKQQHKNTHLYDPVKLSMVIDFIQPLYNVFAKSVMFFMGFG